MSTPSTWSRRFASLITLAFLAACSASFEDRDVDNDGLDDTDEGDLGTDPLDSDTDDDSLEDGYEVHTSHTDPLVFDSDADRLSDGYEVELLLSDPLSGDSDDDRVWDGEEVLDYLTDPLAADSDGDGVGDRADPKPLLASVPGASTPNYALFSLRSDGTQRVQLVETRFQENQVVYTPSAAALVYQTYREDLNGDGRFEENDLGSATIGIMLPDGTRPRLLTIDGPGACATPAVAPGGDHILFCSDRAQPGTFKLELWIMRLDGSDKRKLVFVDGAQAVNEIDSDTHWGAGNRIVFKRQSVPDPAFAKIFVATIDPIAGTVRDVVQRTDGMPGTLLGNSPGDYDAQLSPDGTRLASYRHLSDAGGLFGSWDLWVADTVAPVGDPYAITFVNADPLVQDFFPRWNADGTLLAVWSFDSTAASDPLDVVVLAPSGAERANITHGAGWNEIMPSWHPSDPTLLVVSAIEIP